MPTTQAGEKPLLSTASVMPEPGALVPSGLAAAAEEAAAGTDLGLGPASISSWTTLVPPKLYGSSCAAWATSSMAAAAEASVPDLPLRCV